jgi:mannosyltransferase
MSSPPPLNEIEVIAPNLKKRLSGVTSTILRLVPIQAKAIAIVTTGPGLPEDIPHLPLSKVIRLPRNRTRVWHARRNTEMVMGVFLRDVLRLPLKLLFTSAAQRDHTGFTKSLIAKMDRLVATTRKAASYLQHDATVVMHGVDTDLFHPADDKPAQKHELGLPDGPLIGCFGRIREQKGTDVFVDALLNFLPDHPKAHAVILGRVLPQEQSFLDGITAKIADAGLQDRIHFKGELPWADVLRHYRALDLYVAPQRWEGFGLTPLEAMASGVPVIATPVGAFDEIIVDGVTGTIVPIGNVDRLTTEMGNWLGNSDALKRAAQSSRTHVLENFPIAKEAETLVGIYREMLDTGA